MFSARIKHNLRSGAQDIGANATWKYACSTLHTAIYLGRLLCEMMQFQLSLLQEVKCLLSGNH